MRTPCCQRSVSSDAAGRNHRFIAPAWRMLALFMRSPDNALSLAGTLP
jgi:hypothetical protein